MILQIDWDERRQRRFAFELPASVESIVVDLDGGRVAISINGTEVFSEAGDGTRDCQIQLDRATASEQDWAPRPLD